MKIIPTTEAIGKVIGHDLTEITPGEFKGVAFKKGHIITKEDIDHLLRIGKENIYVIELKENEVHEDDAAIILGNLICGNGTYYTEPSEGKINIKAKYRGLLKIENHLLDDVNDLGDICLATLHGNRIVEKNGLIGGCRVIPLIISKEKINEVQKILSTYPNFMLQVKPFKPLKTAIIVTGSEVYKGIINDKFGPVVHEKVNNFNSEIIMKKIVPDDIITIKDAIIEAKTVGAELIIVTGGMSVDPDDKTPGAIKSTGAEIIAYGTPVLPGSMLLVAYLDDIPIMGLPGCVMFSHTTAFDILLPRVFAGEKIKRRDITKLGYGGLCLKCETCSFPDCHFGKI
ncbi:molybdopterin-binding protein [Alkaliphilus peptidifermentans]|uniref:Molybdopterin molybdenumtransferase n=1 Tax=Alkaliphilus peptidifermentans DSM 18978 TaxID=1120976 RepID=A0A1G5HQJ0_9FIRM|nr:molybdopterin-binding protein [Alkaliphilus peptidifermentans]SCY66135.1 molybdenum cofactor synthesis domain-containing protein [Alkaliphilus peptidifermentans DSM 18978]